MLRSIVRSGLDVSDPFVPEKIASSIKSLSTMSEALFLEYLNILCSQLSFKLYGYIGWGQEVLSPDSGGL